MAKQCVIYVRVSTDRQAEKGLSLPAQEEACKVHAAANDYDVVRVYVDRGESARSADRPQLQAMLDRCKEGDIDAVIVHKLDRLARNVGDHAGIRMVLRKKKTDLLSVTEGIDDSPHGKFMENIIASMAEYYSANLGRETLKGMNRGAKEGRWNGRAPFGYRNEVVVEDGKEQKRVVSDDNAMFVVSAFERFATGRYTAKEIAEWLYEKGVKQKKSDKPLANSTVTRMLRNDFYIGRIKWNGIEAEGLHEGIVSHSLYQQVRRILDRRVSGRSRKRKHDFLLRGTLTCGECGSPVTTEQHKNPAKSRYYRCSKRQCSVPVECSQSYAKAEDIERAVAGLLRTVQLPASLLRKIEKKLLEIHEREQASSTKERKIANRELDKIANKEKSLVNKYIEDKIGEDVYEVVREELSNERIRYKAMLETSETQLQEAIKIVERATKFAHNLNAVYKEADDVLKQHILKACFDSIQIKDGAVSQATLNPPLDYLCMSLPKIKNSPVVFDGEAFGDP